LIPLRSAVEKSPSTILAQMASNEIDWQALTLDGKLHCNDSSGLDTRPRKGFNCDEVDASTEMKETMIVETSARTNSIY